MPVVFQFQPTLDTCVGLRNCDCRARGKLSGEPTEVPRADNRKFAMSTDPES